jgi:hypothetical protein
MANLPEVSSFDAGIYQIETTDPVLGGPSGVTNLPAKNLANRTRWLKDQIDALAAAVDLTATEAWVLEQLQALDHKQSVRAATVANISLAGIQTIDGVSLVVGNRVLVKNQSSAAENGIYLVASLNWTRAPDADSGAKLNSGAVVAVEEGTLQGNSRWQLTTDGPVSIGTTPLVFGDVTSGFAPLASPQFTGSPLAPTPSRFDNDTSLATTEFVQRALGNNAGVEIVAANRAMTAADTGKYLFSNANSLIYTLPDPATLPLGAKFRIAQGNLTSGGTINAPGGVTIGNITAGGTVTSVSMMQSTEYILTVVSATAYQVTIIGGGTTVQALNGYYMMPSGLILQWGISGGVPANGNLVQSLPVSFTTGVFAVFASYVNGAADQTIQITPQVRSSALSTITLRNISTIADAQFYFYVIGR